MMKKNNNTNNKLGIYIHIPFCGQKCNYCDFSTIICGQRFEEDYFDAIAKEIVMWKDKLKDKIVDSIYFGGGTPSVVEAKYIEKICKALYDNFNIGDNIEFSIETNVEDIESSKIKTYVENGINRISIGLQTLNKDLLTLCGRNESADIVKAIKIINDNGCNNINIDVMAGLPNQKISDLIETLSVLIGLNVQHISLYSLILEENTNFYYKYKHGNLTLQDEDEERNMMQVAKKILIENSFFQYEISNYSKANFESKHNLKYWDKEEYLGIGLNSASNIGNYRFKNTTSINSYIDSINNNKFAIIENEELSLNEEKSEFMILGLRKIKGINKSEYKNRFGIDLVIDFGDIIEKHVKNGLLEEDEEKIWFTEKGLDLGDLVNVDLYIK